MSTSKSFCEKESEGIYLDMLTLIIRGDSIQTSVKSQRIWDTILTVDISFASRYFIKFWDPNPNPPQHTSVNIVDSRNEFNVKSSNVKSNNIYIGYVKQLMWKIFIFTWCKQQNVPDIYLKSWRGQQKLYRKLLITEEVFSVPGFIFSPSDLYCSPSSGWFLSLPS